MKYWGLRGPSSFVDQIEHAVRDGLNVIARFPCRTPPGLERELRDRLQSLFDWTTIDASSGGSDPVDLLRRQVCPEVSPLRAGSMNDLADTASFQGRLIWIEKIAGRDWSRWSGALLVYAEACRNVELLSRTVFVVLLTGEAVTDDSPQEVALISRDYCGVVDTLDLFVFALWNAPASIHHREHRALLAHTVAQVAQWDYFLADRLLSVSVEEALYPMNTLKEYARNHGWTAETPWRWELGTVDGKYERPLVHSALLAVSGDSRQVRQRVWAAQAAVLLPVIEERRVGLIPHCRRYLKLPVKIEGYWVSDPLDIELGQLAWHLERTEIPPMIRKQVRRLRDARNMLAHMEPLDPAQALYLANSANIRER